MLRLIIYSLCCCWALPVTGQDWPQPIGFLRAEEEYSFLASDSFAQNGLLQQLKFISLNEGQTSYVSFGFNLRHQYEAFVNNNWGAGPQDRSGWWLQRYMAHADLRFGRRVRFFGQTRTGLFLLNEVAPNPTQRDDFDIHQAFASFLVIDRPDNQLDVRVGRQELWYGARRMISIREGPNVRQSFDVVKAIWTPRGRWRFEALYGQFVPASFGVLDNERATDQEIWLGYATHTGERYNLDAYYIGNRFATTAFDEATTDGVGTGEMRHSLGVRWWNEVGKLQWNNEAVYQFGRYHTGRIAAWTVSVDLSYRLPGKLEPQIGFRTEVISGDRQRGDGDLQTFNALYPRGAYFGLIALIGPANLIDVHPIYRMALSERISLLVDYDLFWRHSLNDGVYGPNVALIRSAEGTSSRFIGHQPGFEVAWAISRYVEWTVEGSYFVTGRFFTETGSGDENVLHLLTQLSFRF